jgi:hypothetical protein
MHLLLMHFKKVYDARSREVLYITIIECSKPMKLVRLLKMCLNETYSKAHITKHMSTHFLFRMVSNKEMIYHHQL